MQTNRGLARLSEEPVKVERMPIDVEKTAGTHLIDRHLAFYWSGFLPGIWPLEQGLGGPQRRQWSRRGCQARIRRTVIAFSICFFILCMIENCSPVEIGSELGGVCAVFALRAALGNP